MCKDKDRRRLECVNDEIQLLECQIRHDTVRIQKHLETDGTRKRKRKRRETSSDQIGSRLFLYLDLSSPSLFYLYILFVPCRCFSFFLKDYRGRLWGHFKRRIWTKSTKTVPLYTIGHKRDRVVLSWAAWVCECVLLDPPLSPPSRLSGPASRDQLYRSHAGPFLHKKKKKHRSVPFFYIYSNSLFDSYFPLFFFFVAWSPLNLILFSPSPPLFFLRRARNVNTDDGRHEKEMKKKKIKKIFRLN